MGGYGLLLFSLPMFPVRRSISRPMMPRSAVGSAFIYHLARSALAREDIKKQ